MSYTDQNLAYHDRKRMSFVVIDFVYFQGIRFLAWATYASYILMDNLKLNEAEFGFLCIQIRQ